MGSLKILSLLVALTKNYFSLHKYSQFLKNKKMDDLGGTIDLYLKKINI